MSYRFSLKLLSASKVCGNLFAQFSDSETSMEKNTCGEIYNNAEVSYEKCPHYVSKWNCMFQLGF